MKTDALRYRQGCIFCGLYALLYTFCLYKNYSGVTFPFFVAGTLCFSVYYMKKQGLTLKKYSYFLMIASLLLGINICMSTSWAVVFFDRLFIFFMMFVLLLHNFYDDRTWDVSRYAAAIVKTVCTAVIYLFRPFIDLANLHKEKQQANPEANPAQQANITASAAPVANQTPQPAPVAPASSPAGQTDNSTPTLERSEAAPAGNVYVTAPNGTVSIPPAAPKKKGTFSYVLLGLAISVPILAVVLPLLITSDAVFSDMMRRIFTFDWNMNVIWVIVMIIVMFMITYALRVRLAVRDPYLDTPVPDKRTQNPMIAITVTCVLLLFYLIYCVIQIVFLFMGYGKLPIGYTYAKYAHEGFYQLVFICIINIALVLICRKFSQDSKALKITLTMISGCTFVMIFSAVYRMMLYISVYRFTFLRLYVLWALLVIILTMIGVVIHIFKPAMPFAKYGVTVLIFTWVVFALSNPDYRIAKYNLTHTNWAAYKEDADSYSDLPSDNVYVRCDLSDDAASAVVRYSKSDVFTKACLEEYTTFDFANHEIYDEDSGRLLIRKWNYSVWNADRLYKQYKE